MFIHINSGAFITGPDGQKHRFGFEYLGGLSAKKGLSNANKNAFTIDGRLFKLPSLDMVEGFHDRKTSFIEKLHLKSRK